MTEQPVETEQQFLGNAPHGITARFAASLGACTPPAPQAYLPNGHRIRPDLPVTVAATEDLPVHVYQDKDQPLPGSDRMDLMLQSETFAHSAVLALSCGELDEAIAWLQSSLAFAQNHRHLVRFEVTGE